MIFSFVPIEPFITARTELQKRVYNLWQSQVESMEKVDFNSLQPTELAAVMEATTRMWQEMNSTGWWDDVCHRWNFSRDFQFIPTGKKGETP